MTAARPRPGYTLVELLAVLAILVVLGALAAPTLTGLGRDGRAKAGADAVRARVAEARAAAVEEGRPYRVAVSADGTRVRVAPDVSAATGEPAPAAGDDPDGPFVAEEELPSGVTAVPVVDAGAQQVADADGWARVVTFLPDGTCREDHAAVEVRQPGGATVVVRVRGLTGATTASKGAGP